MFLTILYYVYDLHVTDVKLSAPLINRIEEPLLVPQYRNYKTTIYKVDTTKTALDLGNTV